jgi:hypothetical protein
LAAARALRFKREKITFVASERDQFAVLVSQRADKGGKLIELLRQLDVSDRGSIGFKGDFRRWDELLRIKVVIIVFQKPHD